MGLAELGGSFVLGLVQVQLCILRPEVCLGLPWF